MSNSVSFNEADFIQNLNNLPTTGAAANNIGIPQYLEGLSAIFGGAELLGRLSNVNLFFSTFDKTTNPLPTTYDDFVDLLLGFFGAQAVTTDPVYHRIWLRGFMDDYSGATHDYMAPEGIGSNTAEPWFQYFGTNTTEPFPAVSPSSFSATDNTDWPISKPTQGNLIGQFKAFFADFLANFQYTPDGKVVVSGDSITSSNYSNYFTIQLAKALATTATLSSNVSGLSVHDAATGTAFRSISPTSSYEDIYLTLFPDEGHSGFITRLQAFYNEQVSERGYFLPSQLYPEWTKQLREEYVEAMKLTGNIFAGETSLASAGFKKTLVLDRIFLLISALLDVMQRVAAVQAERLTVLTNWQQAYTNNIAQIPVFLENMDPPTRISIHPDVPGDVTKKRDMRDTFNTIINNTHRENMQTYRGIVADTAKAEQSRINQSSDAVSQQANMATAIIQELNTLLSVVIPR